MQTVWISDAGEPSEILGSSTWCAAWQGKSTIAIVTEAEVATDSNDFTTVNRIMKSLHVVANATHDDEQLK